MIGSATSHGEHIRVACGKPPPSRYVVNGGAGLVDEAPSSNFEGHSCSSLVTLSHVFGGATRSVPDEEVRGRSTDKSTFALPGIERLRARLTAPAPLSPVQHLIGARMSQVGHGTCVWVMPASPWLQTQAGFFLNGTSALVADFALGGAIGSALPPWTVPVTSDLNFTYLRPIRVDADKLIAQARLIDASRSEATSEALIHDGDGRLLTHATTRCFLQTVEPTDEVPRDYFDEGPYETPDPYERPLPAEFASIPDLGDLSGLEVVQRITDGTLPAPVNSLLGGSSTSQDVEFGRVRRTYPATRWYTSPSGTIYGGLLANLADALTTAAATTTLEARTGMASLDLKVHFLRPGIADGSTLVGDGEVLHGGKGLIVTRAEVCNASGKPVVVATGSFMRRQMREWGPLVSG